MGKLEAECRAVGEAGSMVRAACDPSDQIPEATVREMCEMLTASLRRVTADQDIVEDAIQSAWCRVLQMRRTGQIRNLGAYLYAAARNEVANALAARRWVATIRAVDGAEQADSRADIAQVVERRAFSREALRAMASLRPQERSIFIAVVMRQRTYKECSAALGLPVGTVKGRFYRARRQLRRRLLAWDAAGFGSDGAEA